MYKPGTIKAAVERGGKLKAKANKMITQSGNQTKQQTLAKKVSIIKNKLHLKGKLQAGDLIRKKNSIESGRTISKELDTSIKGLI